MNGRRVLIVLVAMVLVCAGNFVSAGDKQNPNPGKNEVAATFNLSFPMIATDVIDVFYQKEPIYAEDGVTIIDWQLVLDDYGDPIPIEVDESITSAYSGTYPGNDGFFFNTYVIGGDGCAVDLVNNETGAAIPDGSPDMLYLPEEYKMLDWLHDNEQWFDQPATTSSDDPNDVWNAEFVDPPNTWQADWILTEQLVEVDFIDWGNPLENTVVPIVGQRFPVEVALYEKLETPMTAYKVACLEYPSSRIEVFGTSTLDASEYTKDVYFATVLTNKFFAEVWNPDGTRSNITLEPGMGPSGKMNFASAGGGWIPSMPGWHRIWLHLNDPLITLTYAIVNNDEHYIMSTGCMAEELGPNKLELTGIVGDSTFIDVYVEKPKGRNK